ncbi:glycosyltransferase [Selenomonas noxia]|uniref:glycosyltransferase n=1 Tax=Selenomonas noxia TaxID=135083 RepID=UPI0023F1C952|nr:glycosyltransferase [Selenomonas noxia]
MRIAFLTLGTRGDVQPYLALAKELVRQGHSAVVCTSESFRDLIEAASVEYRRAALDLMHLSSTEEGGPARLGISLEEPAPGMEDDP